ncbi:MAG: FumA C-terminus/TtdB family hydratase beta subunit [Candidatus Methanoplasma sp.]|jgi:fumarate hydratase subunit beta|nr:FumA C-terminus/TtdB family hydratase beta subunit [Candidatus Methanoplasma sp.]
MRFIRSPLSREDAASLTLGSVVSLSGPIVTARDEAHMRALEHLREGKAVPECLYGSVLFHCGPIMARDGDGWKAIAAGPTTSARMNSMEPEMIRRFGIRAIIGKGGMSREVCAAMKECGCVYLAATGGAAVSIAESLPKVLGAEWEDLGMAEAVWKFEADRMGPLIVAIDANGDSLYERVSESLVRI